MIDELEMQRLLLCGFSARDEQREIQRNHCRRRAKLSCDRCKMVGRDGSDGATNVHDFRGCQIGRKRSDYAAARHGNLNVAEAQERVSAEKYAVALYRRDGAGG